MQTTTLLGLAVGLLMVAADAASPPPVIRHLGPHVATPAPTPRAAAKRRVISSITVQNTIKGETTVGFEATDFADQGEDRTRVLAAKSYSLADERPELQDLRRRALRQLRELEQTLHEYVDKAGPPEQRAPIGSYQSPAGDY